MRESKQKAALHSMRKPSINPIISYTALYFILGLFISKTTFLLHAAPLTSNTWIIIHSVITILIVVAGCGASINLLLWKDQVANYTLYLAPAMLIGALLDLLHLLTIPLMPPLAFLRLYPESDLWFWLTGRFMFALGLSVSVFSFQLNPNPKGNTAAKNILISTSILVILVGLGLFIKGILPPLEAGNNPTSIKFLAVVLPVVLLIVSVACLKGHSFSKELTIYDLRTLLQEKRVFVYGLHLLIISQLLFLPSGSTNDYYSLVGHALKLGAFGCFLVSLWIAVVTRSYTRIKSMLNLTVEALVEAIDSHEPSTSGHSRRVAEYASLIGKAYGLNAYNLECLWLAAILHDTGKIAIDKKILEKPGSLDEAEWVEVRRHPQNGQKIVRPLKLEWCEQAILQHHERPDGKGYPQGITGIDKIDLFARIIAVADTFDAITTHRHYRPAKGPDQARKIIAEESGKQFDPQCVSAFERVFEEIKAKMD